jgi:hypothetical protein
MNRHGFAKKVSSITMRLSAVTAIVIAVIGTSVVLASAGTLTPSGPPASTMRALDEQKPAWNKIIPAAQRFVDALDGTAVLDKETGLVWAKTLDTTPRNWQAAMDYCLALYLGGRLGWRMPTIDELASLIDRSNPGTVKLPAGHPFQNVQIVETSGYWSGSTDSNDTTMARSVYMNVGNVYSMYKTYNYMYVWPVRAGQQVLKK